MSDDVPWLLTEITTSEKKLPTGSPSSQLVAYFAYKDMFDEIYQLSISNSFVFSLYVDDCTFSSSRVFQRILPYKVKEIVTRYGHKINTKKTKNYNSKDYKIVTGCVITPSGDLKVKNTQRHKIFKQIPKLKNNKITQREIDSLLGRIQSARQIEPNIFNGIKALVSHN